MSETPEQIKKHIKVLGDFEQLYAGFIGAISRLRRTGNCPLTAEQLTEMRREVLKAAPRADVAAAASGYSLSIYHPPMLGGGLKSDTLSAQVLDFEEPGFGVEDDGLDIPRQILDTIPIQISALEMQLEEAEADPPPPQRKSKPIESAKPPREGSRFSWLNHPWVIGIGVTVIGGLILAILIYLASQIF